jgi:DNA gyrase/topoisomerase IV subunit A
LITPEKIDDWIREIEERPSSALMIVRYIAARLSDLTRRNAELLADNVQLRTEKKVEEYEARITNLEYQLDLLRRQLGGEVGPAANPVVESLSLVVYNAQGQVLRCLMPISDLVAGSTAARFAAGTLDGSQPAGLLVTGTHEELLFLFDSGRTVTLPVSALPVASGKLDWGQAYLQEPRGGEELVEVEAVGRMSLVDSCIQVSRRGCVKRMMRSFFETNVSKNFIGTGVKLPTDRTFSLTLCAKDERFVLVSQEGYLIALDAGHLSYAIEETLRLSATDHIVSAFTIGQKPSVVFVTSAGKVVTRETSWLDVPTSLKTRGQAVFSEERRKKGVHLVGAAAVEDSDWAAALDKGGNIIVVPVSELIGSGTLPGLAQNVDLLAICIFRTNANQE